MSKSRNISQFRISVLAMFLVGNLGAADFFVTNLIQFNVAVPLAQPGDTITLANGVWANADLVFIGEGSDSDPITLRAQTSGRVYLTGASRLHLGGSHLVVQGLVFTNGFPQALDVIEFQAGFATLAVSCRVTECAIFDFNPPVPGVETKWVSLYGFSNRVDHCYFKGKQNPGTLMVVRLPPAGGADAATPNYHLIDHNHFGPRPLVGGNGGEIIRVGESDTAFNLSRTIVEYNYFNGCDGEIEIISNKSCENVYRYNTFEECAGTLTLRHGDACRVESNYFLGNDKPATGGVRINGEDHVIMNNYFQNLAGGAGYSAVVLMQGLENSPLNGYFQVRNAVIAFNSLINCSNSLLVGLEATFSESGTNRTTTMPPVDCKIANNIVFTTKRKLVDQRITPVNLVWEGNIMFGTALGIGLVPGILLADPMMGQVADGLWAPLPASPAIGGAKGSFSFVTDDIRGRLRPLAKDVGSDQVNGSGPTRRPLTSADVGPSWSQPLKLELSLIQRSTVALRWRSVAGSVYRVQISTNLAAWTDIGAPITATGATETWEEPWLAGRTRLYRVKQLTE